MRNINRVIMAGNLTRDPEFRQLPSDTPVASFGLALNRRYRSRQGEPQEETSFIDCEAFGRTAEFLRDYACKGRGVFIEGRLRQDRWESEDGKNCSKIRVVVDNVQFTDSPGEAGARGDDRQPSRLTRTELEALLPF